MLAILLGLHVLSIKLESIKYDASRESTQSGLKKKGESALGNLLPGVQYVGFINHLRIFFIFILVINFLLYETIV